MSGVTIVNTLLNADVAVSAKVPTAQIKAGRLPDAITLPALLLREISLVERITLQREGKVRVTERVEVTVRAENYRDQRDIIKIVRQACAGKTGLIAGYERVSVLSAGTGPMLAGPGDTFEKSQDFLVSYIEPA